MDVLFILLIINYNKKMEKVFKVVIVSFLYLYGTVWIFNHVDAWVGIGVFVLGLYISAKLLIKKLK